MQVMEGISPMRQTRRRDMLGEEERGFFNLMDDDSEEEEEGSNKRGFTIATPGNGSFNMESPSPPSHYDTRGSTMAVCPTTTTTTVSRGALFSPTPTSRPPQKAHRWHHPEQPSLQETRSSGFGSVDMAEESMIAEGGLPPATPHKPPSRKSTSTAGTGTGSSGHRSSFGSASSASTKSRFEEDFEVIKTIGHGSFGEVFEVFSRFDQAHYAIKRSHRSFKGPAERNRYLQEVKAMAKICAADSPEKMHVVTYQGGWLADERLYIQMELCETSLDKALEEGMMFQYEQMFDFIRQILMGLSLLHRNGLVHLDIKPGNIFIKQGHFKLGDLGLATAVSSSGSSVEVLVEEGDSRYMSAELLNEGPKDLTKCDIFSLGATVYEVCRGQPLPYNGQEWLDIRQGHLQQLGDLPLDDDLYLLIQTMMAPEPQQRPSAAHLLENNTRLKSKVEQELQKEKERNHMLQGKLLAQEYKKERPPRAYKRAATWCVGADTNYQ